MMIKLLKPVVASIKKGATSPAPSVEVTQKAEDEWFAEMRAEMDKKVFEKAGKMVRLPVMPLLSSIADPHCSAELVRRPADRNLHDPVCVPFLLPPFAARSQRLLAVPWGQLEFLRQTRDIKKERFVWTAT